ncbi:MAG: DEAD/DEAH box helicase [Cytophagaceae bacterium]
MTFADLGIHSTFIQALSELSIQEPTEIQVKAIPVLLKQDEDLIAQAQTGTGKTAAFGLPLLHKIDPLNPKVQALVLCPTRELGQQIAKQLFKFTKFSSKIFIEAVYGGAPIDLQIKALDRPTHIVVATPGRLIDLLDRKAIDLSDVKYVVLDEADEMLSMGFREDLDTILKTTAGQRNTWLFSATMSGEIKQIISSYMSKDALSIQIDKKNQVNKNIEHRYFICEDKEKTEVLIQFLKDQGKNRGLVFCKTKATAQKLAKQLVAKNISADAIHGDLQQRDRDKVMRAFKNTTLQVLVATDLAARGIDVESLLYVVHYNFPEQLEYYTHRSGRTARAGKRGISLCLISQTELGKLRETEKFLSISIKPVK